MASPGFFARGRSIAEKRAARFVISAALLLCVTSTTTTGQVTVLTDDFESGVFSTDWDSIGGSGTGVVFDAGNAAGGSDYYARIEGATGSDVGLGLTLDGLTPGSPFSTDWTATFDFRVDNTTNRQFNFQVSAGSATPTSGSATLNLRYEGGVWAAYDNSWNTIGGLGTIVPGQWNTMTISGFNWGSGVPGGSLYDISLTDHLSNNTTANNLNIFQLGNPDLDGASSLNFNDRWGNNPGYDLDNVTVMATPGVAPPTEVVITPTNPVAYSGIYPHMAVTNTHSEVGIGGIIKRGNDVYFMTYGPHIVTGGSDELYKVNLTSKEHTTYLEYPGNTDANRYTDTTLGIDVVGAAYIDNTDTIRYLPVSSPGDLRGRITGTSAHLTDPNKLYYMTMEEGLYEVDFSDLNNPVITTLRLDGNGSGGGGSKNLPGVHGKGLFTGQGHLYFTNNGAGEGFEGGLVEWDGAGDPELISSWTVVDDQSQYTEVTSRQGPIDMDPASTDAIWATGWDDESMFINTRDATSGTWTKFRMPKSSYTHGHPNGWYTEWPRIRDVGLADGYLMSHHGGMFLVPDTFSIQDPSDVKPINTHHKMVVDYVEDGTQIVFANNDASRFSNGLVQKANSNLMFIDKANIENYGGNPSGFGGVWLNDAVNSGANSDAFLINGYEQRVIHFEHENSGSVDFVVEVDINGDGTWTQHTVVSVEGTSGSGTGYGYYKLPENLDAQWVRFRPNSTVSSATVYLHASNGSKQTNTAQLQSIADVAAPQARSQGFLRSNDDGDFKLEFAADILDANGNITGTGYYRGQLNPTTAQLELVAVTDAAAEASVRSDAVTSQDFSVDAASVIVSDGGTNYRLPKGHASFDTATASGWRRGEREVVTERAVMNLHGTIYELPRNFTGGGIERIRPITTHNRDIFDFASWRGMLVLSGNNLSATEDGHYVETDDGNAGLWFGNVDDLWTFGAPRGEGGPWLNSAVSNGVASDPYLMTGYDQKILKLEHASGGDVEFTIQVDFLGTNQWEVFDTLTVGAGESLVYAFEEGYSAHWVRLISNTNTTASAQFLYLPDFELIDMSWDVDGSGSWTENDNWSFAAPNGSGWAATFGDAISTARTVTVGSTGQVTGLTFDNANGYLLSGAGSVEMVANGVGPYVEVTQGSHEVAVDLAITSNTTGSIATGATLNLSGGLHLGGNTLNLTGTGSIQVTDVTVSTDGSATVGGTASIAGGLDLTQTTEMVLGTSVNLLTSEGLTGEFDNALITGTELTAVANTRVAVLYEDSGTDGNADLDIVRLMATYQGDLNGDGIVGPADLTEMKLNWLSTDANWQQGDVNYDDNVGPADLTQLKLTWLSSLPPAPETVPEPSSLVLLGLGGVALMRRRR